MGELEQMKKDYPHNADANNIVILADQYCDSLPIVIVTDRYLNFSPNEHYYSSMSPYIWPDPVNKGKYVVIDGKANPDSKYYDSGKLLEVATRCERLSKAYYFTRDKRYYNAFIKQLCVWFIDSETYMCPNFEYAQVIPGRNNDKGTSTGMIDAYFFNTIIESIRLVDGEKIIKRRIKKDLQKWFMDFADWSEQTHGVYMREKDNHNIGVAYDVTIANMYLFAGRPEKAKPIVDGFAERRILKQIKEDGTQPMELQRPNAFEYSIYNLTHLLDFCYLAQYWDRNYYSNYGERIDKALSFLQMYVDSPESLPYPKLGNVKSARKSLNEQLTRRDKIRK